MKNDFNTDKKKSLLINTNESYVQFLLSIKQLQFFNYIKMKLEEQVMLNKLNKIIKRNKKQKIVFWGASLFLKEFLTKYKIKNSNILGIVDKNTNLQDTKLGAYEIFTPENSLNSSPML